METEVKYIIFNSKENIQCSMQDNNSFLRASLTVVDMPQEMYNDALLFLKKANGSDGYFEKSCYYRAAITFFCTTVESWVNKQIVSKLECKAATNLTQTESELLEFLRDPEANLPNNVKLSIVNKLKNILPNLIMPGSSTIENTKIEAYLELSRLRNSVIHYSRASFEKVYKSGELAALTNNAPNIVEELLTEFCNKSGESIPDWVKERDWRDMDKSRECDENTNPYP